MDGTDVGLSFSIITINVYRSVIQSGALSVGTNHSPPLHFLLWKCGCGDCAALLLNPRFHYRGVLDSALVDIHSCGE
jgi:hypothetical protein